MRPIAKDMDRIIVDAGCGRGGTAHYLQRNGWGKVIGFDVEPASIAAARERYPATQFHVCDVCDAHNVIDVKADVVCIFNAYYCFPRQREALRALRQISKPGARLVIFDHVDRGSYDPHALTDADAPFLPNPPLLSQFPAKLEAAGWDIERIEEAHDSYARWYAGLVSRIEGKRTEIVALAGAAGYDHVLSLYQGLLNAARQNQLGAAFVRAVAKGSQ